MPKGGTKNLAVNSSGVVSSLESGSGRDRRSFVNVADLSVQTAIADALDCLHYGVIIVDVYSEVVFMNACAEEIVAKFNGLSLRENRIVGATTVETMALRDLVGAAANITHGDEMHRSNGAITLSRRPPLRSLTAIVTPLGGPKDATTPGPVAAIFITDPEVDDNGTGESLMRVYGLTAAESRLTIDLLQGKGLAWAAEQNNMKLNTARCHLKHVFEKTRTHRQAELVRVILRSPAMLRLR